MNFDKVKHNLEEKGFVVSCFETAKDATEYLKGAIKNKTVGFGGSVTVDTMGLYEVLAENNNVVWHHKAQEGKTAKELIGEACGSQVFIASVNGLAETGEVINIDGACNRVSAIFYGKEKVYLVVGKNKIAPDYESALWRARNIAAPLNAKRLNKKTPCAVKADRCYDCKSPERICRGLTVLWNKPSGGSEYEIVLINEELGY